MNFGADLGRVFRVRALASVPAETFSSGMQIPFQLTVLLLLSPPLLAADFSSRFEELREKASPAQLYALLYDAPKGGDLHNHLGGSDRAEWIFDVCVDPARNGGDTFYTRAQIPAEPDAIAPRARFHTIRKRTYDQLAAVARAEYVALPALTPAERVAWCNSMRLDAPGEGRREFFDAIWPRRGDLSRSLPVRLELLAENIRAFAAEGVRYLETQFGPEGFVTNDGRAVPVAEVVAAVRRRLAQPDLAATGLVVRFQENIVRFLPDSEAQITSAYAFVDAHRDLWVGLNLVGIEENGRGYPARFLETFRQLRSLYPGIALSIHAGEMDGPDSHVRDTLLLGATRIGHGVNLIHDSNTLLLLQQSQRALVEINLISNRLLEYTPDLSRHPFPEYFRTGVPVCLNTDDRGMWDSNLTDEYYTAVTQFRLSWREVVQLGRNSLQHAFAQPDVKAKLLADYAERIAAFENRYGAGSVADALAALRQVKPVTYGYAKRTWGLEFR
jgi:adenosine deaminase CECR1